MADFDDLMLRKVVYTHFYPESNILAISITQFLEIAIFDITPPKMAIFENVKIDVLVKISGLWV